MRRSDDVFYLTLIDFLVQVFFFGLLLYAVARLADDGAKAKGSSLEDEVAKLKAASGVSNIVELTDEMSRLTPAKDFKGSVGVIVAVGGVAEIQRVFKLLRSNGGLEKMLGDLEKAYGSPPCEYLPDVSGGKRLPLAIATIIVRDDELVVESSRDEFSKLVSDLGLVASQVQRLTVSEFRSKFARATQISPHCRHFVNLRVETKFLDPMDAVGSCFRIWKRL